MINKDLANFDLKAWFLVKWDYLHQVYPYIFDELYIYSFLVTGLMIWNIIAIAYMFTHSPKKKKTLFQSIKSLILLGPPAWTSLVIALIQSLYNKIHNIYNEVNDIEEISILDRACGMRAPTKNNDD